MLTWQNTGDPCAPDTFTFVNHLMPTRIGYTTALGPQPIGSGTVVITSDNDYFPRGLAYFDGSGAQNFLYTLSNKIFKYDGSTDTNVSRATAYTNGAFSFAQYRDSVYACNGADLLQKSTTGAFADVAATPKLTRIATNGDYLAGINNVASFGTTPIAASTNRVWVSGTGDPEQFDPALDSTAYTQEIRDDGGPLVAIARLRDFFVLLKKSGVYVMQYTGQAPYLWSIQPVSSYFGCEWPDSVIEVNNILYWISPTRSGEVVAFDGSQITVLSGALSSTIIDQTPAYLSAGFAGVGIGESLKGGITAASDGETIVWSRFDAAFSSIQGGIATKQLYLNVPTGRFGFSDFYTTTNANATSIPFGVYSNAWQNAILTVCSTQIRAGDNRFKTGAMIQSPFSGYGAAEWYRGGPQITSINNVTLRFSEYVYKSPILLGRTIKSNLDTFASAGYSVLSALWDGISEPTLQWASTQTSGDAITKNESAAIAVPTGVWNSKTKSFNVPATTARSKSASVFAFSVSGLAPYNSLTSVVVDATQAGAKQAGAKSVQWQ